MLGSDESNFRMKTISKQQSFTGLILYVTLCQHGARCPRRGENTKKLSQGFSQRFLMFSVTRNTMKIISKSSIEGFLS